jgi:hypothetical protein|tara:strand:+ start:498 stop:692 length:195 start_codon:yes stop_codon:yes gene_type:complete
MPKNREERLSIAQRQERQFVDLGQPTLSELQDGVPVFRKVGANVIQFIRVGNQLYQTTLTPMGT